MEEPKGRSDYFEICRKGFPHRRDIQEVDAASEEAIVVVKPKGTVKLPAIDKLSPDFIAYVPAPLIDYATKKNQQEEASGTNTNEAEIESDDEVSDEAAACGEAAEGLDAGLAEVRAACEEEARLAWEGLDQIQCGKRLRRANRERVGEYERVAMETDAITARALTQFLDPATIKPGMSVAELTALVSEENAELCQESVKQELAYYYRENDIDMKWLVDNFVLQDEKDEYAQAVRQLLALVDESLLETDELLVRENLTEWEYSAPPPLAKSPALFFCTQSVLNRILAARQRPRLECNARTLSPIPLEESARLFDELKQVRQKIETQLESGQKNNSVSCLVYQGIVDDLLEAFMNALHAFFLRRLAGFYRERIEISSYLLAQNESIPIHSPTYHCLYWVFYEFKMIETLLVEGWFSIAEMSDELYCVDDSYENSASEEDVEWNPKRAKKLELAEGEDSEELIEDSEDSEGTGDENSGDFEEDNTERERRLSGPRSRKALTLTQQMREKELQRETSPQRESEKGQAAQIQSSAQLPFKMAEASQSVSHEVSPSSLKKPTSPTAPKSAKASPFKPVITNAETTATPSPATRKKGKAAAGDQLPYDIEFKTLLVFSKELQKAILLDRPLTLAAVKKGDMPCAVLTLNDPSNSTDLDKLSSETQLLLRNEGLDAIEYLVPGNLRCLLVFAIGQDSSALSLCQFSTFQSTHKKLAPLLSEAFVSSKMTVSGKEGDCSTKALGRIVVDGGLYEHARLFCKKEETLIYEYFIHYMKFLSFLLGKAEAALYLFLNWFLPKVFGRECDKVEVQDVIRSLVQFDIPALVPISALTITLKNGKKHNLASLIEDFYCYLYHWHPRALEWKNDSQAKHRLDYPISATDLKNFRQYETRVLPLKDLNSRLLF